MKLGASEIFEIYVQVLFPMLLTSPWGWGPGCLIVGSPRWQYYCAGQQLFYILRDIKLCYGGMFEPLTSLVVLGLLLRGYWAGAAPLA